MFDVSKVVDALTDAVDGLLDAELATCADDEVLGLLRDVERQVNRLAAVDAKLVGEVEVRGLARARACASTGTLLRQLLRVGSGQAAARVRAATDLGPRRGLTGEPLPPVFAQSAAALRAGNITPGQARLITRTITSLPVEVAAEHDTAAEALLVEQAAVLDADLLGTVARRLVDTLNPDGVLDIERHRDRNRTVEVRQRPDGSVTGRFELTAGCGEALLSAFDTLARPVPEADGVRDPRSAGQRRHDALQQLCLLGLRSGQLPASGVTTTILLTISEQQLRTRAGLAVTGHGARVSIDQALAMAGEARVLPVVFDTARAVAGYGTAQRLFTETQRLAMIARDQGCSFPSCTVPPLWCEAHHVTGWAATRRTSIDDGTLLCGFHHAHHERLGWSCTMIDGVPHWTPPRWLDPDRRPRRNTMHEMAPLDVPAAARDPVLV